MPGSKPRLTLSILIAAFTLAVVIGGGMGYFHRKEPEPAPSSSEITAPHGEPTIRAPAPITAPRTQRERFTPLELPIPTLGQPNPYAAIPKDSILEFRDVGGLAVAFGDIVLGKLEDGWNKKRGRFDTPIPQLWEKPEIPYAISSDLANPGRVEQALNYFRDHTPVRFVAYSGQPDAIVFETGSENCLSLLGRIGGTQPIKLSSKCQPPQIIHEIMHALGFVHEQSRPDRDQYVTVLWPNIEEEYQAQYAMVSEYFTEAMRGSTFDLHSAMLYRPDEFAISPQSPTMRSLSDTPVSPVNGGLSPEDIRRLDRLYAQPEQ